MVKCANCNRYALYTYQVSSSYIIHYCQSHLPKFLLARRNAGQLPLIIPAPVVVEPVVEAPKTSKKKEVVVEEPVVEETPVEEPLTEE
jgi:hypothetical protein